MHVQFPYGVAAEGHELVDGTLLGMAAVDAAITSKPSPLYVSGANRTRGGGRHAASSLLTATRPAHEAAVTQRLAAVGVEVNKAMPADEASPLYVPVPNRRKAMVDKLLERVIPHAGAN